MLYEAVSLYKECIYKSLKIKFGNYELYRNVTKLLTAKIKLNKRLHYSFKGKENEKIWNKVFVLR